MKIKNSQLYAMMPFFHRYGQTALSIPETVKNSTVISKLNDAIKIIEEIRVSIANKDCEKDANGDPKYADPKKQFIILAPDGEKKINELMDLESDVAVEGPMYNYQDIEASGVKITVPEWEALKNTLLKPIVIDTPKEQKETK